MVNRMHHGWINYIQTSFLLRRRGLIISRHFTQTRRLQWPCERLLFLLCFGRELRKYLEYRLTILIRYIHIPIHGARSTNLTSVSRFFREAVLLHSWIAINSWNSISSSLLRGSELVYYRGHEKTLNERIRSKKFCYASRF